MYANRFMRLSRLAGGYTDEVYEGDYRWAMLREIFPHYCPKNVSKINKQYEIFTWYKS